MQNNKNKTKLIIDRHIMISFWICSITMFVFCIYTKYRFGEVNSLQAGDMLNLYVPAIRSFVRNLYSGQGLAYSWDLSLGMNATEYYTSVMGGSIFNLLYLLFPWMEAEVFVLLSLCLKTGLMGAFFTLFCKKVLSSQGEIAVFFSIFYCFCGFQICAGMINYIWIDLFYMLPLILWLLVRLVEEKKWFWLVPAYAYSFLCCFYIAYILGIFSALFLLWYVVVNRIWRRIGIGNLGKRLCLFGGCVVWAVGLTAFALLPTAYFILTKSPADATPASSDLVQHSVLLLFSRFLFAIPFRQYFSLPFLYCGIPALLLLPLYITDRRIEGKEKCLYVCLTAIMLLSCLSLPLYLLWHGFDAPDGWNFRFSFLISFLCLVMACKEANILLTYERRKMWLWGGFMAAMVAGLLYCGKNLYQFPEDYAVIANMGIVLGWLLLFLLMNKTGNKNRKVLLLLGMSFAICEVWGNATLQRRTFQSGEEMEIFGEEIQDALSLIEEDRDFYRIQCENSLHTNADTYWGYKGIADLGTFENYEVRRTLGSLGAYMSPRYMEGYGLNPVTQLLLGVKYVIHTSGSEQREGAGATISQYPRTLGLGFLVGKETGKIELQEDVFENCNALACVLTGEELQIFREVPQDSLFIEEGGITLKPGPGMEGYVLERENSSGDVAQIVYYVPDIGKDVYGVFTSYVIGNLSDRPYIYEFEKTRDHGTFGMKYTKKLDKWGDKLVYAIVMEKGITRDVDRYIKAQFAYVEEEAVERLYQNLSQGQMKVLDYRNGYVKGQVSVQEDKQLLFTSIPYDKGWSVKVHRHNNDTSGTENCQDAEAKIVPLLAGAFLGVELPSQGEYELIFSYTPPGLNIGIWISTICLGGLLIYLIKGRVPVIKNRNNHINEC